jgi:hypothetical protein
MGTKATTQKDRIAKFVAAVHDQRPVDGYTLAAVPEPASIALWLLAADILLTMARGLVP